MSTRTAPVPSESVETATDSGRRVGLIVLVVLVVAASVGAGLCYRASNTDHPPAYTAEQLQAMDALVLPGQFNRADSPSCQSNEQSACFTSSLTGVDAMETLTAAMGAKQYTTTMGHGQVPATYTFCAQIASAPAAVTVSANVVNVHLTGPNTCP